MKGSRINLKPLTKDFEDKLDPTRVLKSLKRDLLKRIKKAIEIQDAFSTKAKVALAKALTVTVQKSSVQITAHHPAWGPLVLGMKKQQMLWLLKARAPIPIITETGKLIFRSATPKSFADGKWVHPGYQKTNLLERVKKETKAFVRERVRKQVQAILRKATHA